MGRRYRMITVTVNDVVSSINTFKAIAAQQLPIKAAYGIARLIKEIDRENETFVSARQALIDKYGQRDEEGNLISEDGNLYIQKDKIQVFKEELQELLDSEIELNAEKISVENLGDVQLTSLQVSEILAFIKD